MSMIYVNSTSSCIKFSTNCNQLVQYLYKDTAPPRLIPDYFVSDNSSQKQKWELIYNNLHRKSLNLDFRNGLIQYSGELGKDIDSRDVSVLLLLMSERERQEKGLYSCYSSAVSKKGHGVIFLGGSMSGKTSLALGLARYNGFKFISNEISVIDFYNGNIEGGTKVIAINKKPLEEYFPDLFSLTSNIQNLNNDSWHLHLRPEKIGLGTEKKSELDLVLLPKIDKGEKELKLFKLDKQISLIKLHEISASLIGGSSFFLFDYSQQAPDFDSKSISQRRIIDIKEFLGRHEILYIEGTFQSILDWIDGMVG